MPADAQCFPFPHRWVSIIGTHVRRENPVV